MNYKRTLMTSCVYLDITIQTKDVESHARMTKLSKEYDRAITQSIDYLRGQLKAIEDQYKDEMRVG